MTKLNELLKELHRRSLWQVLAIYVVGAWIGALIYFIVLSIAMQARFQKGSWRTIRLKLGD